MHRLWCIVLKWREITYYYSCRFMQLISLVPTDPGVLQRLGEMFDADNDRSQAFQYYFEVHILHCFIVTPLTVTLVLFSHFATFQRTLTSSLGWEHTTWIHSLLTKPSTTLRELPWYSEKFVPMYQFQRWDCRISYPQTKPDQLATDGCKLS